MKQRIFSGIQPSGTLHLGNYLGAIKNWVALQEKFESIFCIVDLHAITVPQDPDELRQKTLELAKIYLAAGIDTQESTIFVQSHIPEHTELAWILGTITGNNDLLRMTQAKSKGKFDFDLINEKLEDLDFSLTSTRGEFTARSLMEKNIQVIDEINKEIRKQLVNFQKLRTGLFTYPILMAADILLYNTNLVPVGEDQVQHVELARELAKRFNRIFGETFAIPEPHIAKEGMRIMGLDDPTKKMSKSAPSEMNYIALTDTPEKIREKIKKAVTDSGKDIRYADDKPAIKNLINIYALLDNAKPKDIEESYKGKGYSEFKADLAEVIVDFLADFQKKYNAIDDNEVLKILEAGKEKAKAIAEKKMNEVKEKVGLLM